MKKNFLILFFILLFIPKLSFSKEVIYVYAASSLSNVINEVIEEYNLIYNQNVKNIFDGSGNLARQIKAGAPASIFISADEKWINELEKSNLIENNTRKSLLSNSIVIIAPKDSKINEIDLKGNVDFKKILGKNKFVIGNPESVPNGAYAKEAFLSLGLWDNIKDNLAMVQNVRVALNYVSMGEAPLGVVFFTDANADSKVKIVSVFPKESHKKIIYPFAIIKGRKSKNIENLYNFLQSEKARDIYKKYGFIVN